jgi:hypothetical protein
VKWTVIKTLVLNLLLLIMVFIPIYLLAFIRGEVFTVQIDRILLSVWVCLIEDLRSLETFLYFIGKALSIVEFLFQSFDLVFSLFCYHYIYLYFRVDQSLVS